MADIKDGMWHFIYNNRVQTKFVNDVNVYYIHGYGLYESDIHLLDTAPDLLEACISALEPLENLCPEYADIQPFIDKIRAALAKVEIYPPIPNYD